MGRSDSPLTEVGIQTAKQMARMLKPEGIAAVFSSPLGRATSSANIYVEPLGLPIALRDGMAELSCGLWEGKPRSEFTQHAWKLRETWQQKPPDGESYEDAENRVAAVIREIRTKSVPPVVLVVGHAGVNRVFLKLWLELPEDTAIEIMFPHDIVYLLEGDNRVRGKSAAGEEFSGLLVETERFSGDHQRGSR